MREEKKQGAEEGTEGKEAALRKEQKEKRQGVEEGTEGKEARC